jgi:hypothetical protein
MTLSIQITSAQIRDVTWAPPRRRARERLSGRQRRRIERLFRVLDAKTLLLGDADHPEAWTMGRPEHFVSRRRDSRWGPTARDVQRLQLQGRVRVEATKACAFGRVGGAREIRVEVVEK